LRYDASDIDLTCALMFAAYSETGDIMSGLGISGYGRPSGNADGALLVGVAGEDVLLLCLRFRVDD